MGQKEDKEKTRKEKLAGYFYNISQLSFAGLVLGGFTPFLTDNNNDHINWLFILFGIITTSVVAYIANKILK